MHFPTTTKKTPQALLFPSIQGGIFFSIVLWAVPLYATEPISVVATLPVLKDFTEEIGGRHVAVTSLIKGLESEHTYTPKPSDVIAIRRARLLVKIGLGLEVWVDPLIENADRTDLPVVITSEGVSLVDDVSHALEHPGESTANPHIWLDPENAKIMIRNIVEGLIKIDPEHKDDFIQNQSHYLRELDILVRELMETVNVLPDKAIITHHPAWPYFSRRFGFIIKGDILSQIGSRPSARHIGGLIELIRKEGIRVIVSEPQLSPKIPKILADETGAKVVVLSPLPGAIPGTETYFDLIRHNTQALVAALRGS
ncbi:MAG: metal ABC transporter substrate-binding protein [Nitrospiria bacterium]